MVEIWQCDAQGIYSHPGDSGHKRHDAAFQGYGRVQVDADGRYAFRTIRPVAYPGRTPHIHFKVHAPGVGRLTTQMYVAGERQNATDGPLNGIRDRKARDTLIVALARGRRPRGGRAQGHVRHRARRLMRAGKAYPRPSADGVTLLKSWAVRDHLTGRTRANAMSEVTNFRACAADRAQVRRDDCHELRHIDSHGCPAADADRLRACRLQRFSKTGVF